MKVEVVTDFIDGSVRRKKGDVFDIHHKVSLTHLLNTGQVKEFKPKQKEEKVEVKTKEVKVETETKSEKPKRGRPKKQ